MNIFRTYYCMLFEKQIILSAPRTREITKWAPVPSELRASYKELPYNLLNPWYKILLKLHGVDARYFHKALGFFKYSVCYKIFSLQ